MGPVNQSQAMSTPPASIRDLARRLLALEAARSTETDAHVHDVVRVCEKLRFCVTRFAGADGFTALLRRALALAQADDPSLQTVKVTANGRLEGIEEFAAGVGNAGIEAATAITAHLLGLLATFIGDALMLRLLRQAWPDASLKK
jgi:hypothetical protein